MSGGSSRVGAGRLLVAGSRFAVAGGLAAGFGVGLATGAGRVAGLAGAGPGVRGATLDALLGSTVPTGAGDLSAARRASGESASFLGGSAPAPPGNWASSAASTRENRRVV